NAAIFGSMHECGHALYEQQIGPELVGTNLFEGTSMGIHESQSRFWENVIGRSYPFWERYYGQLQELFPSELGSVSLAAFHRAINVVHPSPIRVEADEVTYNLHIMMRYEIEKGLIGGDLRVKDLPEIWRAKAKEDLGLELATDRDGVLQDVHWSAGLIGYFPSYTLGNLYSAQFTTALIQSMPDFTQAIRQGQFTEIRAWLRDQIHRHGRQKTPQEIVRAVTGSDLKVDDLLSYLTQKFEPLYGLQ
ncbi:MAG: carboxypeptidase M32, partial [Firmicutes bacterium]|nr:carboxypeptidase M32 [Bacillota bacterium]